MNIIEPSVELWKQDDDKHHVANCARVCYKKETGDDDKLINHLIKSNHWSVFRHQSVYAIIPYSVNISLCIKRFSECPYIKYIITDDVILVSTNENFMLDLRKRISIEEDNRDFKLLYETINFNSVSPDYFYNTELGFKLMRYTFCVVTQISTSRELNRVSPNNITEQSTRYVYEDGTICRPYWLKEYDIIKTLYDEYYIYKNGKNDDDINHKVFNYIKQCDLGFDTYEYLVNAGLHRQDARGVLPLDTATKCIYTYSIDEWRAILDLRYYGTTGKPHPNAKVIADMIRDNLIQLGYEFR